MKKHLRGLTTIEVVVVANILLILAAIAGVSYFNLAEKIGAPGLAKQAQTHNITLTEQQAQAIRKLNKGQTYTAKTPQKTCTFEKIAEETRANSRGSDMTALWNNWNVTCENTPAFLLGQPPNNQPN